MEDREVFIKSEWRSKIDIKVSYIFFIQIVKCLRSSFPETIEHLFTSTFRMDVFNWLLVKKKIIL